MSPESRSLVPEYSFSPEVTSIRENLHRGVTSLLDDRSMRLLHHPEFIQDGREIDRQTEFLRESTIDTLDERIARSLELKSPEVTEAKRLAKALLPGELAIIDCIDGRMPPSIMFGFSLGMVKGYRSPAGNLLYEHDETQEGKLVLQDGSILDELFKAFSTSKPGTPKFEALGSHLGCAAQLREEQARGSTPPDNGLYVNVLMKKAKAQHIESTYGITTLQYSFDPLTGYTYWGLDKQENLDIARAQGRTYTRELLADLSTPPTDSEGNEVAPTQLFSTSYIASRFEDSFKKNAFDITWARQYKETAVQFWTNMTTMSQEILPEIEVMVENLYSGSEITLSPADTRMRALLMLSNAYNAWLHTQDGRPFPFDMHDEDCVVIDQKSKGPFVHHPALVVTPEPQTIAHDILLAQSIIRANRDNPHRTNGNHKAHVYDQTEHYTEDGPEWVQAPVLNIYKSEVDLPGDDRDTWDMIRSIDWDNKIRLADGRNISMRHAWRHISNENFQTWLGTQLGPELDDETFNKIYMVINRLRTTLDVAMTDHYCGQLATKGSIFIVPLLVSSDRQPQAVAQFAT